MNRRSFLLALSTVAMGHRLFGKETPQVLLRYRFKKGEELHWNVQHTLKMRNIIGGREENIETRSRAVKIWKTLDVDRQGAAMFEYRVEDVDMHQSKTGREDAVYNSRRDKTIPPEFINLTEKIGVPLARIKIDPQGKTSKQPIREYEGSMSENRIVIPLPDEHISIGMSWSEPKTIDHPIQNGRVKKIRIRHDFTLERIVSDGATIKFSTVILTPLTPKEETELLENYSVGTMQLDLREGHFIRHQSTIDRHVVGVESAADSIYYLARVTECCCGRRACDICRVREV